MNDPNNVTPMVNNNPFAAAPSRASETSVSEGHIQREAQEVQVMMIVAKRFPRDPRAAMDKILRDCTRPKLADGALYSYARGGANITGPSIRLAEAIAQAWGNIQYGIRELDQGRGESTVEAFAWDMESNTRQVKVFRVPHVRHTKKGQHKLEDPRDIYEAVANQGARRLRACILGVIPGDVTEAAVVQCEETQHATADVTSAGIKATVDAFAKLGVTKEMLEARIQRRIDAINPALKIQLGKIYASIRDGMSSPGDWFSVQQAAGDAPPATGTEAVKAALAKDAPPAPVATPAASEVSEQGKDRARILADVQEASAIKHVSNIEDKYRDLAESEGWADALIDSCAARVNEIRESRGQ